MTSPTHAGQTVCVVEFEDSSNPDLEPAFFTYALATDIPHDLLQQRIFDLVLDQFHSTTLDPLIWGPGNEDWLDVDAVFRATEWSALRSVNLSGSVTVRNLDTGGTFSCEYGISTIR